MKKFLLSLMAVLVCAYTVQAHDNGLFVAVQFPDGNQPMIDGNDDDWSMIPIDVYSLQNDRLNSLDGFAEAAGIEELDASSLNIRHLAGWNEVSNHIYVTSRVYDDIHIIRRVDPGRFYWDDSWEVDINALHETREQHNAGETATSFSYKFAFPPVEGTFEWLRPNRNLSWLTSGSQWFTVDFGFEGDEFGESTYIYEVAIQPISSMPKNNEAAEGEVIIHDLTEGETVHIGIIVNEVDGGEGEDDNRIGQWGTQVEGCCHADMDLLIAPVDDSIAWAATNGTAVEAASWGMIKAQY